MGKMVVTFSLIVLALTTVPAYGQQLPPDAPSREEVLRFLDIMHSRDQMTQVLQTVAQQMKTMTREMMAEKVPNATPAQIARMDKLMTDLIGEIKVDQLIEDAIPVYQRHISKSDLDAVVAFYISPPGQRLLKEMPAMMAESMQASMGHLKEMMKGIDEKTKQAVEDMEREAHKPN